MGVPVFFLHWWVDYPTRRLPSAAVLLVLVAALAASRHSRVATHLACAAEAGDP